MKFAAAFFLCLLSTGAYAEIIAHKFAPASTKQDIYNLEFLLDIETTNWVAWNTSPTLTGGLLGPGSVKPNMHITIANPSREIDARTFNDNSGPRAVLYGEAATTPDVVRIEGANTVTYDESGAFNGVFNQSGNYWFEFYVRDMDGPVFHDELWLLVDVDTDPPVPVLKWWGEEQVANGDFSDTVIGDFALAGYGKWDGNAIVEGGAAKFTESGSLIQYVNVRHLSEKINEGHVSAISNVAAYAHTGNPVPYQSVTSALGGSIASPFKVPVGTEFIQVRATGVLDEVVDDLSLRLYVDGDYNNDGEWTVDDLDLLTAAIRANEVSWRYDLSGNGAVTLEDRRVWIEDLVGSSFGDANLDGSFDSGDFVTVFQGGKYEGADAASWMEGDFSGDALFDSSDLTLALSLGAYEEGVAAIGVPEVSLSPCWLILLVCFNQRKKNIHRYSDGAPAL